LPLSGFGMVRSIFVDVRMCGYEVVFDSHQPNRPPSL